MKNFYNIVVILLSLLISNAALAQSTVLQNGPWTFGHVSVYSNRGSGSPTISDAGPARGGNVGVTPSELALTATGSGNPPYAGTGTGPSGTNFCDYDGPSTGTNYHFLCFSANAQGGGLIDYGAAGLATPLPLNFLINGTKYTFPFTTGGIVGPGTSVVGDLACWNNATGSLLSDCGAKVAGANPTAQVGNSVINGSATTFMRSDAAPALASGAALANIGTGNITNTYLTNPSVTVSGQTCTLGSSCTIPTSGLSSIANNTVLGNVSGISAAPSAINQTQLTALISPFSTSGSGAVPISPGGTTSFLRADGTWNSAGITIPSGTTNDLLYYTGSNTVGPLATANNGVLVTNGSGVPSINQILPTPVQANISLTNTYISALCQNTTGDGAIIQNAVNTGRSVFLSGPCNLDAPVTLNTPSQLIFGLGADQTVLNISTVLPTGAFIVNTGNPGPGPIFQDFSFNFNQNTPICTDITGTITSGNTLSASAVANGTLSVGQQLFVQGYLAAGTIVSQSSGTPGGAGSYNITSSPNVSGQPISILGSCSRSGLIAFTPAIYAQNQTRLSLFRMKISGGAMIGIDGRGNSGGWVIDDFKEASLSVGLWFDGSGDTNRINNWHFWPYAANGASFNADTANLYYSTNTSCTPQSTSGSAGAIGLYSGQAFLQITNGLTISGQGWCLVSSVSGPGTGYGPLLQASNVSFDTFNGIVMSGGIAEITTGYFTLTDTSRFAILQNGGALTISDSYFGDSGSTIPTVTPAITFTGGYENGTTGTASLTLTGNVFDATTTFAPFLLANSFTGNGGVILDSNTLHTNSASGTYATPVIHVVGNNTTSKIVNSKFDAGNGSGVAITVDVDNWNTAALNTAPGWLMSYPVTPTQGIYACNNSASGVTCGSGGGGGVNPGTGGQVPWYATTGSTLSGNVNLTTTSTGHLHAAGDATADTSAASIYTPVNAGYYAAGKMFGYGDNSGHQFLGETGGNGGTGVEIQNKMFPSVTNSFDLGGSSFVWANLYAQNAILSTSATINSNTVPSVTGAITNGHCVQFSGTSGLVTDAGSGCGGSGSGTVNSGTTKQLAWYAATGTAVSGNSNLTTTTGGNIHVAGDATADVSVASIYTPANSGIYGAGKMFGYNDNLGHTFLGETVANGGAGIEVQNILFPSVTNSIGLGGSGNVWSTVYTQALNVTGISGTTQCLQANSAGVISGTGSACSAGGGAVSSVSGSGSGISVSPTTGAVVVSNTGVTSATAGVGISLSGSTGGVTISNSGVTSISTSGNLTGSGAGGVAIGMTATPTFTGVSVTSNVNDGAGNVGLSFSAGTPYFGNSTNTSFVVSGGGSAGLLPFTDNAYVLGGSSNRWTTVYATTATINTSDMREKSWVNDETLGIKFIRKLRPLSYVWRNKNIKGTFHGFFAQEVEEALDGAEFAGLVKPEDNSGLYGLRYEEFIAPLTKAVQEEDTEIQQLKKEVAELRAIVNELRAR